MTAEIVIPRSLEALRNEGAERTAWLERLPDLVRESQQRWELTLGQPFDGDEVSCAWVAPVTRTDGSNAVLKIGMPHMEGEHEIEGLRFWHGDPTVRLLDADEEANAMLLERCQPRSFLRAVPEPEQDEVIALLLRRLWRAPPVGHAFRPLEEMTTYWATETRGRAEQRPDPGLVQEGLRLLIELPRTAPSEAVLATDLHAGNVLRAQREPWLVIDPKPFVGDRAYDATQHLLNCLARLRKDHKTTIGRFADLLGVDAERVRLWTFARAAAEPWGEWTDDMSLARALAP